jgi:glycosyltransferase involved in cell wall biosynthesis
MPAYRRPQFIPEAIESVRAQTHTNWRLVVSENGPGGGEVEEAVRPYLSDPRIRYVATGRNLGPAANWTRLIQTGTGPYVTLIGDDNIWDRDFLASRVGFLERRRSCGLVFSGERIMDRDGREIAVDRTPSMATADVSEVLAEGVYSPRELFTALYRHQIGGIHTPTISCGGVMCRRSALDAVGAYFDDAVHALFDVELYMRMALRYPTGFLAIRDVSLRAHHPSAQMPSISSDSTADGEHWIHYQAYYAELIRRELPDLTLPRQNNRLRAQAFVMGALDAIERGDRRQGARYLSSAIRAHPPALLNPRVPAAAIGVLLGDRGTRLLTRARGAARRRNAVLAYEHADTGRA